MHAQGEYVAASSPTEEIVALNEEAVALRNILYSDAVALVNRGFVSGEPLKEFKTAPGYKNLGEDLVGLSALLRKSWDKVAARTMTTMDELDRAEEVSDRLLQAVAQRENSASVLAEAAQQRQQVFTLFVNAYDQARRAIAYLRWREEDVEDIAPSLYAGRGRRKGEPEKPERPATAPESTPPAGTAPAPAPVAGVPQHNPFAPPQS